MQIKTACPIGCKYISGGRCIASECPYSYGNVQYDIRMNTFTPPKTEEKKSETEIIKAFLKQQYNQYNNAISDAIDAKIAARDNGDIDEADAQHRLAEKYMAYACVVFDVYKDLTGERLDGKPNDYVPDGVFRSGNENSARMTRERFYER